MRSFGTTLNTRVQADRHGPSITTISPEARTRSNRSRNGPTCPPGLDRIRTSARTGITVRAPTKIVASIVLARAVRILPLRLTRRSASQLPGILSVPSFTAQCRQADAGGIEAAIDRQSLSRDVAGAITAEEEYRVRQFLFEPVAVERNRIVIVGADFRGMDRFCHRGLDRAWRDAVDANAERGQLDGELLGEVRQRGLAGAVGRTQRRGAHRRDRGD